MNISQAVILVGGRGKRLEPITSKIPKPLVKVSDKPIIVHIINHYLSYGLKNFYLALGYKSEKFHDFFSKNKSLFDNENQHSLKCKIST